MMSNDITDNVVVASRIEAAAIITAAAIQNGYVKVQDIDGIAGYFGSIHHRLFGSIPKTKGD